MVLVSVRLGGLKIHAIILCAGYGTRLYPLTKDTPKPLITIAGRPLVEHILEKINKLGAVSEITLVTNEKFYEHFDRWSRTYQHVKPTKVLNDKTTSNDDRLGAVGDLHLVINQLNIDDDILLVGGDNLFDFSLSELHNFSLHKQSSVIALHDLRDTARVAKKYGVALLDNEQKILDFQEKPEEPQSTLAATLCYFLKKSDVQKVKQYMGESGTFDNAGDLIAWLSKQQPGVHGFTFSGYWFDIGSHESLAEARTFMGEQL